MTQLALLLVLGLLGSLLSFAFGRLEVRRGPVSATVKRAEGALERASLALLRLGGARGLGLLAVPALGLSVFALLATTPSSISSGGRAAFCAVCLLAGGLSALAQARLALAFGARAASSAAAARARGSARTMRPLLRASVASAVFGEGLGLLGVAAVFSGLYAIRGGFAAAEPSAHLASDIARLLPAFALGAAVTALVLAREGSVASAAARLGAQPSEPGTGGGSVHAQDPALLAQLMGQLVGELLPCALASYVGGLVATISAALLAVSGVAGAAGTLASLLLLVVVRAFGAVASVCGVLAARVTDDEPPLRALLRGQLCAAVVGSFGLGAALFWLMREHWGALFVSGAAGLCSALAVALGASWPLQRRLAARDDANGGDAGLLARGLGGGFASSWPSLLLPALAFAAVERAWGAQVAAPALLVSFVAGALALAPFALALASFGVLAQHTRGVVALARLEQEPKARSARLDEASLLGRAAGGTQASLALGGGLLLGLSSSWATTGSGSPGLGSASLSILLGAALLTLFGARAAASASEGARLVTAEVERQSREVARAEGSPPSYKACVDAALGVARSGSVLELAALLLSPFLLGSLLRSSGVPGGDGALPAFGVAAVAAGLIFTLGGRATRARLGEQRQRAHAGAATPSATQAESFGDLLGVTAAASVEALAFVLALTVLCLAPLLR